MSQKLPDPVVAGGGRGHVLDHIHGDLPALLTQDPGTQELLLRLNPGLHALIPNR